MLGCTTSAWSNYWMFFLGGDSLTCGIDLLSAAVIIAESASCGLVLGTRSSFRLKGTESRLGLMVFSEVSGLSELSIFSAGE